MNIYESNLKQLKAKFPEVYDWIMNDKEDMNVEVIRTESGHNNLRIKGLQGKSICLYDMDDPLKAENEIYKDLEFESDGVTILVGIGLGYLVDIIREKMRKGHKILVIEKNATILKAALARTDICVLLRDDSIIFSMPDQEEIKSNIAKYILDKKEEDAKLICIEKLMTSCKEYRETVELVRNQCDACLTKMRTLLVAGANRISVINEIENFPKFLFSSGIKNLFGKFEQIPAIIISAGPSLEKNCHMLKQAKGKALLLATAPIVRVLLAHKIIPDLMVSIDFGAGNRKHFNGICDRTDIPLVYCNEITPGIVKDFQGDMFTIHEGRFASWLHNNWDYKGDINGGGSVAIFALMTALACGCDPIIFVGQDLAFSVSSGRSHVEGRLGGKTVEIACREDHLWVDGIYGEKVPTTGALLGFKCETEKIMAQFDRTFINCTEGGADIKGTKVMGLEECIDRYCKASFDGESIISRSKYIEKVDYNGLKGDIRAKVGEIRKMSNLCEKGLKNNKKVEKRVGNGLVNDLKTEKLLRDNFHTSKRLQQFCESFVPLGAFLYEEMYEIGRQAYSYKPSAYNKSEELNVGLKRNKYILSGTQKALKQFYSRLPDLLELLDKLESSRGYVVENSKNGKAHHQYGKVLSEIGLHKLAIEEYKEALRFGNDTGEIFYDLGISYIRLGRLSRAEEFFDLAKQSGGKDNLIEKGNQELAEIKNKWLEEAESYFRDGDWVNALLYARKLLREYPSHQRAQEIVKEAEGLRDEKIRMVEEANEREKAKRCTEERHRRLVELAKDLLNKRENQQAIDCLEEVFELDYDRDEANALLACCYSEMGDIDQARRCFEELSAKFPKSGQYHLSLGRVFIRNKRFNEAAEQLELAATKEKKYYQVLFESGTIYMQVQNYDKAIECFERYLEMSPDSYELLVKIGTCYLAKGNPWLAKRKYREALKTQPDYEAAQVGLRKIEEMEHKSLKDRPYGLE